MTSALTAAARQRRERSRSDAKVQVLIEAAGPVFAEKGFAEATGKEIAEQAGVNAAAVNYYFGGIEGLYAAVLQEAHDRLLSYQTVSDTVAGEVDPESKLRALITLIVRTLTGPASSSWMLRVLSREFLAPSPSPAMEALRRRELPRKAKIIRGIVSGVMGLPEDHPAVARGCISVMAPCILLLVGDRRALKLAFPRLKLGADGADAIAAHMVRYALAGLTAVSRELQE